MDIKTYPNIIIYDVLEKYINKNKDNNELENKNIINNEKNIIIEKDNLIEEDYNITYTKAVMEYNNYFNSVYDQTNAIKDNYDNSDSNKIENLELESESESESKNVEFLTDNNEYLLNNKLKDSILESANNTLTKLEEIDDPWESSINDDKFYISNKVARIFPVLKNFNNFSKIKIDDESFCYITIREIADVMSKIICYHLLEYNLNPLKSKIIDYTSGVGGNVLSFCKYFKYVYAIEVSDKRIEYLQNNINVYGFKNIEVINSCAIEFNSKNMLNINPSVIFIDPPWGGINYKNNDSLVLNLGSMRIEELIFDITVKFSNYYKEIVELNPKDKTNNFNNKFIVLKLPKNYDIEYLYNFIKLKNNLSNYNISLYLYILNKMLIIVCELQFKYYN